MLFFVTDKYSYSMIFLGYPTYKEKVRKRPGGRPEGM